MMRIILIGLLFLSGVHSSAQVVTFSKNVFKSKETISATIVGGLQGIENGVTNTSYGASQGTLNLGVAPGPGFYRIDFRFENDVLKSFLIGVIDVSQQTSDIYNIELSEGKITSISPNIAEKMLLYFKMETNSQSLLAISKRGLIKFCKDNAVALVSNVSFCISTISGVPIVTTICQSLSVSNAKKLGIEVAKAFVADMKAKAYITQSEYDLMIVAIDAAQLGAILKSNCSLIFKNLKNLSNNPNLKLAIGYFEQQCKTTVLIIETFKAVP